MKSFKSYRLIPFRFFILPENPESILDSSDAGNITDSLAGMVTDDHDLNGNGLALVLRIVDALMPKAMFLDPNTVAIKLAREQMLDEPIEKIEKTYTKGVRRLRYNQNVLLAATWSWILVKRGKVDEAFKALTEALKNSDNEVLKRNHECLMNNRVAHFNNSGLGDQWYSLLLEEPKVKMQRPRSVYR